MFATTSWPPALMVLLCSIVSSTDAWLFARVTASTVPTITDRIPATTTLASSPLGFSSALTVSDFDYEKAEAAPWCSWWQGQEWKGYVMHCGVDYFQGGDLLGQWVNSVDDCVAMCNNISDCNFLSYQAETDDGSYGMCWLKDGPGVRRHDKTILGMSRVAARVPPSSPSVSSEASSTSSTVLASSTASSLSTSTPSMSVSFTISPTTISSFSSQAFPASTRVPASSSTRLPSVTAVVEPTQTAAQGESGGDSSAVPSFWFSEAHPCYPNECSTPVTTYGRTSYPLTAITSLSQKATVTESGVTNKVLSSSKTSIIQPVTKSTSSVGYSTAPISSRYSKASTKSFAYSLPSVSPEYVWPSSTHTYLKPHQVSGSSKLSSYSCAIVTGMITCTGSDDTVSTKITFTTTTLVPGTRTTTVYKTLSSQPPRTSAVKSGSKAYPMSRPTMSKTAMSGKPTVSTSTGKSTVTSEITVTSKTTAAEYTSVSSRPVSTTYIPVSIPTSTSGAAKSTYTRSLTSKTTVTSKILGSTKSTTSGTASVTSSSPNASKSTASGVSSGSSVVSKFSTTISDQWRDPSTWYAPTFTRHTAKPISSGGIKPSYTAGHYSHPESSSASSATSRSSPISVYSPSTSKDVVSSTSQGSVYTSSVRASVPYTTVSTARVTDVSSTTSLQGGAHASSSLFTSPQPTSPVTPTQSGPVTKSVNVSWSWTSTPKPSSDRSAGRGV
ncbi:hypothetical protein E8E11_005562 [Didymella keratinophila]|nr:hypothetical protein E8E11_005562 [Didymella keratinophila]